MTTLAFQPLLSATPATRRPRATRHTPAPRTFGPSRLRAYFPIYCSGTAVSYTCLSLCEELAAHLPTEMHVPTAPKHLTASTLRRAIPSLLASPAYRLDRHRPFIADLQAQRFLASARPGDVAWLWPNSPISLLQKLRDRGITVITESINCHQATAKSILDDAFARLHLPLTHNLTPASIQHESDFLALADFVFSPSPRVADSLRAAGLPNHRILPTSYGWSPSRLPLAPAKPLHNNPIQILFLGSVCVRKGAHLLADAWSAANLPGTLLFAGALAPELADSPLLKNAPRTRFAGYIDNVASLFRASDIFAFPTLEEGGPQVTYEAAAQGLPIVTTPMGAGALLRNGIDAIVLDPHDRDAWIHTLKTLAANPDLRRRLGDAARARAAQFTWSHVARQRFDLLQNVLSPWSMLP